MVETGNLKLFECEVDYKTIELQCKIFLQNLCHAFFFFNVTGHKRKVPDSMTGTFWHSSLIFPLYNILNS